MKVGDIVEIPVRWVGTQGYGTPIRNTPHAMLVRGFDRDKQYTDAYRDFIETLVTPKNPTPFRVRNEADLGVRIKALHRMSQRPLPSDPLPVNLGCYGIFHLFDGHHRLGSAVARGADAVNVEVKTIDSRWADMSRLLSGMYPGGKTLYNEIEHPYFDDWRVLRNSDRYKSIGGDLATRLPASASVLDIGSCSGRMSRELSRRGFNVTGIDRDWKITFVSDWLNHVFLTNIRYDLDDLDDWLASNSVRFGAVVALSVFHHWLKNGPDKIRDALKAVRDCTGIFVTDLPCAGQDDFTRSTIPLDKVEEFYQSCFPGWSRGSLGTHDNRPLVIFEKGA